MGFLAVSASTWATFRAKAARSPEATRYEPLGAATWSSLETIVPSRPPAAMIFFTKPFLCRRWLEQNLYPERLLAMVRYGVPTKAYWRLIRDTARRTGLPLHFVGDLDPFDLTTFLALRSGDPDLRRPRHEALPITLAGIDDAWLKLCERHARRKGELPYFKMSALELEHRDLILKLAPWLLELLGPRCADLLQAGMKIELEGASNPVSYDPGFLSVLRAHLLRHCTRRNMRR